MRPRPAAIAVAAAALLYMAVAYGTGMDRLAAIGDAQPGSVPAPFRAEAHVVRANELLQRRQYQTAAAEAEAALRSMPLDYRTTGLVGVTRYFQGKTLEANDAFTVSERIGWRDTYTQAYWLEVAQRSGDATKAAERVDALLRANPSSPIVAASLTAIEADPAIRVALAERMRRKPGWINHYAASAAEVTGPQFTNRLDVVTRAAAMGARAQCIDMRDAVASLLYRQNRPAEARGLWNVTCGNGREPAVGNGSFAAPIPEYGTAFDWIMPGHGGVQSQIQGQALVVDNRTSVAEIAASQTVLLPPGPVRLQWRANAARDDADLGATVALVCPDGLAVELRAARSGAGGLYTAAGTISPRCPQQVLSVMALPGAGRTTIDDIAVAGPPTPAP